MVSFFFADNTVLVSFATIGRMDLLQTLFNGKGAWCPTVRDECHDSANFPGLGSIIDADTFLGAPIMPTKSELLRAQQFRTQLAKPGESKYKHLGEAETLAVMVGRYNFEILVTDDLDAKRLAAHHNVRVVTTLGLLKLVERLNLAQPHDVIDYLRVLRSRGAPVITSVTDLRNWANCP